MKNLLLHSLFNGKCSIVRWRQFARKGYSAFASMHKVICIGILSVATLAVAAKADAQKASSNSPLAGEELEVSPPGEDIEGSWPLSEVTVSGTMAPLSQLQVARIVCIITRQDIDGAAAQSVNDLLKLATGVDVRQRGGLVFRRTSASMAAPLTRSRSCSTA